MCHSYREGLVLAVEPNKSIASVARLEYSFSSDTKIFQQQWGIDLFLFLINCSTLFWFLNHGLTMFISRKFARDIIGRWCPITLLGVASKIMGKYLSLRA